VKLTKKILRQLLTYNPETGALTWRRRSRKWFSTDRAWRRFNTQFAGRPAFNTSAHGYLRGRLFTKTYAAHRIIWMWVTGRWPFPEVDHKDKDGKNNRWNNLRQATRQVNNLNKYKYRTNKSGYSGVQFRCGKFRVVKTGAAFSTLEEAIVYKVHITRQIIRKVERTL
jgi:hypothetical protein